MSLGKIDTRVVTNLYSEINTQVVREDLRQIY
jgi:hypothetical protein